MLKETVVIFVKAHKGISRGTCGKILGIHGNLCDVIMEGAQQCWTMDDVPQDAVSDDPEVIAQILTAQLEYLRNAMSVIAKTSNLDNARELAIIYRHDSRIV